VGYADAVGGAAYRQGRLHDEFRGAAGVAVTGAWKSGARCRGMAYSALFTGNATVHPHAGVSVYDGSRWLELTMPRGRIRFRHVALAVGTGEPEIVRRVPAAAPVFSHREARACKALTVGDRAPRPIHAVSPATNPLVVVGPSAGCLPLMRGPGAMIASMRADVACVRSPAAGTPPGWPSAGCRRRASARGPESGRGREYHCFCASPASWVLGRQAEDATARCTAR